MACGASARCRASRRSLTQRHRIYNRLNCLRHTAAKSIRTGGMAMEGGAGYNAAGDLIERNLVAGRGAKPAFIDEGGAYSYAELAERVGRFANTVRQLGVQPEQRILLCLLDTIDFPSAFLGAIKAGVVPVAVNTQLSADEFAFMLADSRARAVIVSQPLLPAINAALALLPEPL